MNLLLLLLCRILSTSIYNQTGSQISAFLQRPIEHDWYLDEIWWNGKYPRQFRNILTDAGLLAKHVQLNLFPKSCQYFSTEYLYLFLLQFMQWNCNLNWFLFLMINILTLFIIRIKISLRNSGFSSGVVRICKTLV